MAITVFPTGSQGSVTNSSSVSVGTITGGTLNVDSNIWVVFRYDQGTAQQRNIFQFSSTYPGVMQLGVDVGSSQYYGAIFEAPWRSTTTSWACSNVESGGFAALGFRIQHEGHGYRLVDFDANYGGTSETQNITCPTVTSTSTSQIVVRGVMYTWSGSGGTIGSPGGGYVNILNIDGTGGRVRADYIAATGGAEGTATYSVSKSAGWQYMAFSAVLAPAPYPDTPRLMQAPRASDVGSSASYAHPAIVRDGNGRLWSFHMASGAQTHAYSDDDGLTWTTFSATLGVQNTGSLVNDVSIMCIDQEVWYSYVDGTVNGYIVCGGFRLSGDTVGETHVRTLTNLFLQGTSGMDVVKLPDGKFLHVIWGYVSGTGSYAYYYQRDHAGSTSPNEVGRGSAVVLGNSSTNLANVGFFERNTKTTAATQSPKLAWTTFVGGGLKRVTHTSAGAAYSVGHDAADTVPNIVSVLSAVQAIYTPTTIYIPRATSKDWWTLPTSSYFTSSSQTWTQNTEGFGDLGGTPPGRVWSLGGAQAWNDEYYAVMTVGTTVSPHAQKGTWLRRYDANMVPKGDWQRMPQKGFLDTRQGEAYEPYEILLYNNTPPSIYPPQSSASETNNRYYRFWFIPAASGGGGFEGWGMVPM